MYVTLKKGASTVGAEAKRQATRKALAYDLKQIIDKELARETYIKEEIKKIIDVYIETEDQK